MRTRHLVVAVSLVAVATHAAVGSSGPTWTPTLALGPTDVTSLDARPGLLLAGGREVWKAAFGGGDRVVSSPRVRGLFVSRDAGRSWDLAVQTVARPDGGVARIPITETPELVAVAPADVRAFAVFGRAVWRSDDDADTWGRVGELPAAPSLLDVLPDGRLVAGLPSGGLLASPDGTAWSAIGSGLPAARVNQLAVVDAEVVLAATEAGIFRSTDRGASFTEAAEGLHDDEAAARGVVVRGEGATAKPYLAASGGLAGTVVYSSQDRGATWMPVMPIVSADTPLLPVIQPGGFEVATVLPDPAIGGRTDVLYAGTSTGLYESIVRTRTEVSEFGAFTNQPGLAWTRVAPSPGARSVRDLSVADQNPGPDRADAVFASVAGASPYRRMVQTQGSGLTAPGWFDETDRGRTCLQLVIRPDGEQFLACGRHVLRSSDRGATWSDASANLPYGSAVGESYFPLVASADGSLWTSGFADGLWRSDPAVSSWSRVPFPGASVGAVATHPTDPNVVYAAGLTTNGCCRTVLHRSTNGGLTWLPVLETGDNIYTIAVSPHDPRFVLVAAFDEGGWRSEDGGATWTKVTTLPPAPSNVSSIRYSPAQPGVAYAVASQGQDSIVYRSSDFGRTWADRGVIDDPFPVLSTSDPDVLFIADPTQGIARSEDGGATWRKLNDGLHGTAAGAIAEDPARPGRLFAAAGVLSDVSTGPPSYWFYRLDP